MKIQSHVPKELEKYFIEEPIVFKVSIFEEMMLNDLYERDEDSKIKLHRNITKEFHHEMKLYKQEKRNIRLSIKGETRTGKSLDAMRVTEEIISIGDSKQDFEVDIEKIVCGNQIEYRQALKEAEFGDFYLVDENLFQKGGMGSNIEAMQLKDYNAIIAKKNIDVIFINPETFLNVGATLGLSTFGRDSKNWYARMLVYKFKDGFPFLLGYIILDIGILFRKYGCYVYKFTGGCTNSKKQSFSSLPKEIVEHSSCIDKDKLKSIKKDEVTSDCPFYNICSHPLSRYEKKKDSWIDKEMSGKLDERSFERFLVSLKIILNLQPTIDENDLTIKLRAKNGKDLKNRARLLLPRFTNTKMGIGEFEELVEIIKSNCDIYMLVETLRSLEKEGEKLKEKFLQLENGELIQEVINSLEDSQV